MDASELRIGNYVLLEDKGLYQIDSGHDIDEIDSFPVDSDYCQGVTLTEEWLLKFGWGTFYYNQEKGYKFDYDTIDGTIYFRFVPSFGFYVTFDSLSPQFGLGVEYVHQLQNLYFALTGEELTPKTKRSI